MDKHIIYRNQTEARVDQFLYEENGFLILGGLLVAVFVGGVLYGKFREWYRWHSFKRRYTKAGRLKSW